MQEPARRRAKQLEALDGRGRSSLRPHGLSSDDAGQGRGQRPDSDRFDKAELAQDD